MKKTITFLLFSLLGGAVGTSAEINGFLDVAKITTPAAPSASFARLNINSVSNVINCQNPDATTCFSVNQSGAAAPTLPATTNFYSIGSAASNSRILGIAYAGVSFMTNARYDGTPASPTAVQSGEQIGGYNAFGYNGTALVGPVATLRVFANQTFTGSVQGAYMDIMTTPNGTQTAVASMRWEASGGVTLPSTVTGGDKGVGSLNAAALYVNGTAVVTSTSLVIGTTPISGSSANAVLYVDGSGILQNAANVTRTAAGTLTFGTSTISPLYTAAAAFIARPGADSTTAHQLQNLVGTTFFNIDTTNVRVTVGNCSAASNTLFVQNCTATTGSTSTLIKGGAGNATSDKLLDVQNNSGTSNFSVTMAGNVVTAGSITSSASITAVGFSNGNANTYQWANGSYLFGAATTGANVGTMRIVASGGTTAINFGGDTSSFPALKRSTTTLQAKLADDSAFTDLSIRAIQHLGTTFTLSGCATTSALTGGSTAGSFSTTTTGSCAAVVTFGNSATAPNGWACTVSDQTTGNLMRQTASTTTTATLSGTTVSGDVIVFSCDAY